MMARYISDVNIDLVDPLWEIIWLVCMYVVYIMYNVSGSMLCDCSFCIPM